MSGICGILNFNEKKEIEKVILKKMMEKLKHRGPNGEGYFVKGNVGLGHTKLKINSEDAEHPMSNENNSIWITCDGEIYNYIELKQLLSGKGHIFKTRSDIEVIIHLYEEYGERCLEYLRGVFAFALWDDNEKKLFIARDRIGEKPLYYVYKNGVFIFASEIKSLLEFSEYRREINFEGINYLFAYDWWIPWPYTAFKDIYKMEPATYFVIKNGKLKEVKYWIPDFKNKIEKNKKEIIEELYNLIDESTKIRLRDNTFFGALLSGGVDSSIILAFMKDYVSKVKTFSLGFKGEEDPEILRAREVAKKFNTEHYEILFNPQDLMENIYQLVKNHDEPYVCITGIYLWFLTKYINEMGIKIVLSGNGADEVFWGYSSGVNLKIKFIVNELSTLLPKNFYKFVSKILPGSKNFRERLRNLGIDFSEKIEKGINGNFYKNTTGLFSKNWPKIPLNYGFLAKKYFEEAKEGNLLDGYSYMAFMLTYAHSLTFQTDLNSMANGVIIRSPFLDQEIIEYAMKLPLGLKIKGFTPKGCKYILKKTMERKLPKNLLYAKKFNFGTGIKWEKWLLEKYNERIKNEILESIWVKNKFFEKEYIERLFGSKPNINIALQILRIYTFCLWYKIYFEK